MAKGLGTIGAITLFVDDVEQSKAWYVAAFGLPVTYEDDVSAVITLDNTIINLLKRSAADGLIAPAEVARPGGGSTAQYTFWVEDVDTESADLTARGILLLNGPMNRDWGMRTAAFADPDGHIWELAQSLS